MKKIIYALLILVLSIACFNFYSSAYAGFNATSLVIIGEAKFNKAKVYFSEINYDFGKVKEGETLSHNFTFKNIGDGKLIINSIQPACGCTDATLNGKNEFEKDEQGMIAVTFSTQGRSGVNRKTVQVNTNDESNPSITLSFSCDIQQ